MKNVFGEFLVLKKEKIYFFFILVQIGLLFEKALNTLVYRIIKCSGQRNDYT